MPLGDIIQKEEIVYTPLAQEIVDLSRRAGE